MNPDDETTPIPRRKQCQRHNIAGHVHYLTFSCFRRQSFLSRDRTRQWLVDAIDRTRSRHPFELWAYVIMPEHAHLVLLPLDDHYSVSHILSAIKLPVARRAVAFMHREAPAFGAKMADPAMDGTVTFRSWQRGGGYDRNLWTAEEMWEKIDYVNNNPVRRKLCARADEWPWSSAADYAGTATGPLSLDLESRPNRLWRLVLGGERGWRTVCWREHLGHAHSGRAPCPATGIGLAAREGMAPKIILTEKENPPDLSEG